MENVAQEKKFPLAKQFEYKNKLIAPSVYFNEYWQELVKELTRNKKKLFPK